MNSFPIFQPASRDNPRGRQPRYDSTVAGESRCAGWPEKPVFSFAVLLCAGRFFKRRVFETRNCKPQSQSPCRALRHSCTRIHDHVQALRGRGHREQINSQPSLQQGHISQQPVVLNTHTKAEYHVYGTILQKMDIIRIRP